MQHLTRDAAIDAFAKLHAELEDIRQAKTSKTDVFLQATEHLQKAVDRGGLLIPAIPISVDFATMWRYEDKPQPTDGGAAIWPFLRRLMHYHTVSKRILDILRDDVLWQIHANEPPASARAAPPVAEVVVTDPNDRQYAVLLDLMQPLVRLLEWTKRYITLLGDDRGATSRIARSSHLDHFRTAAEELRAGWRRYEPAVMDERVRGAFAEDHLWTLAAKLAQIPEADRDGWDDTVRAMHEHAQALDGAIRGALRDYQRAGQGAKDPEHEFMRAAIEEARKSKNEPNKTPLFVGAVVVRDGKIIARGHRGQHKLGEHAEFTTLQRNLESPDAAANATLYCTLEPCTLRNHPKTPCVEWVKEHRITRVVIGVVDPNPRIRGGGVKLLRQAGIDVALFPGHLANEIEALNRAFEREHEYTPAQQVVAKPRGFHQPNTVPEIFCEWRRWENPTGRLEEIEGAFDKAWMETDEAGERSIWDVLVIDAKDVAAFYERASALSARMAMIRTDWKAMRYYLVAAVVGDAPGDAERGAKSLMAQVWPGKLGVSLLFGWIAKHHFVSEAMMHAG